MRDATSTVGTSAEITAPVRVEGQSNSEVLFNWLSVKRHLWMLEAPHDQDLERIVGQMAVIRLGFKLIKWKRIHAEGHEALVAPPEEKARQAAFTRLEKLMDVHFFDAEGDEDE